MHLICLHYEYGVVQKYKKPKWIKFSPESNAAEAHGLGGRVCVWMQLKSISSFVLKPNLKFYYAVYNS